MIHSRLNVWRPEPASLCFVDPVSALIGGGIGLLGGLFGSGAGSTPTAAAPVAPQAPPPPIQQPVGTKNEARTPQQTFIGAAATPPPQASGQKTLLGQ